MFAKIPRLIHFVWVGSQPPPLWARQNVEFFKRFNPEFTVHRHGEEVLLKCFRHAYDRVEGGHLWARRADILRVCALLRYGGWYFDCDFLVIRPLKDLYRAYRQFTRITDTAVVSTDCFLTKCAYHHETGQVIIANGVIASTADSPMLALIAKGILMAAETERELAWDAYGPGLYTTLVGLHPELVTLGEIKDFYPIQDAVKAREAYKRIAQKQYAFQANVDELGKPLPHMFHFAMEGGTEL